MNWFLCALFCTGVAAQAESGYRVKVDFTYKNKSRSMQTKSEVILAADSTGFLPVTAGVDGVALLAKLSEFDADSLRMDFMVVDTKTTPVGLQTFRVRTMLNQEATVSSTVLPEDIVSVRAQVSPVEYESEAD